MEHQDALSLLRQHPLLKNLNEKEWNAFLQLLQKVNLQSGDYAIKEHETSTDLYFILEGELEALKQDSAQEHEFIIGQLKKGEVFGEIAFMDSQPRLMSIRAHQFSQLVKLPQQNPDTQNALYLAVYNKIQEAITQISLQRLRATNQKYVESLKEKIRHFEAQNRFGIFFIMIIAVYSVESLLVFLLKTHLEAAGRTVFYNFHLLILLIPIICTVKYACYSLKTFGWTWKDAGKALQDVAGITGIALAVAYVGYSVIDVSFSSFFEQFFRMIQPQLNLSFLGFIIPHIVVAEFINRGVIQTALHSFLEDKAGIKTVLINAALLEFLNVSVDFLPFVLTFCFNILLGLFYTRYSTLVGVVALHIILSLIIGHH